MADDIVAKKGECLLKCISDGVAAGFSQNEMSDPFLLAIFTAWKIKVLPILHEAQDQNLDLEVSGELLELMDDDRDDSERSRMRAFIASNTYFLIGSSDCIGQTPLVPFSDLNVQLHEDTLTSVDKVRITVDEVNFDCLPLGNVQYVP